jgi:beta-glucosidase
MEEYDVNKYDPLFDFGYGLSYTTFEYSDLFTDKKSYSIGEPIKVSVRVMNSGKSAGKEAVELYLTDKIGSVSRPVKQLKRFMKIELKPNEDKTIHFTLDPNALSFIGRDNKRIIESGGFTIQIGKLKTEFNLTQ